MNQAPVAPRMTRAVTKAAMMRYLVCTPQRLPVLRARPAGTPGWCVFSGLFPCLLRRAPGLFGIAAAQLGWAVDIWTWSIERA